MEAVGSEISATGAEANNQRGVAPGEAPVPLRRGVGAQDVLLGIAKELEFCHTEEGEPFVRTPSGAFALRSREFRDWMAGAAYRQHGVTSFGHAFEDALGILTAQALHDSPTRDVHLRVARQDGEIYIDLAGRDGAAVKVTARGWETLDSTSVWFRRSKSMKALPRPMKGDGIARLRKYLPKVDESSFRLLVAYMVMALRGNGPFPILALTGEQGSAKSTTTRMIRALTDPNTSPARAFCQSEGDLAVAAKHSWIIAFDNVSSISPAYSDALCRLATGGGFSKRANYTDDAEVVFNATRPVILNGIGDSLRRADLRDRSLIVQLPVIHPSERRDERTLWEDFERDRAAIFGALLDGVASALRRERMVVLGSPPRMADFAVWATAAEEGLGWSDGAFVRAYEISRRASMEAALDNDFCAQLICGPLLFDGRWKGTAGSLLPALHVLAKEAGITSRVELPNSPQALSKYLVEIAPILRAHGVECRRTREGQAGQRMITIWRDGETRNPASVSSVASADHSDNRTGE